MNWLATALFAGATQALLLAVLILSIKTGSRVANLFLAGFLALMAITLWMNFLVYSGIALAAPLYAPHMLQVLSGPALYLYVRALTEPDFRLSPRLAWHALILLPALLYYLVRLYQVGFDAVLSGMAVLKGDALIIQVISVTLLLIYGGMSLQRLSAHRALIEESLSVIEEVSLAWLKWLILLFIGVRVLRLAMVLTSNLGYLAFELRTWLSLLSSLAIVYLISLGGLRQPVIFTQSIRSVLARVQDPQAFRPTAASSANGDTSAPSPPAAESSDAAASAQESPGHKYKKTGLDTQRMAAIWSQLGEVMEEQQPHLANELNLAELADMTAVKPHDLSRVINAHAGVSFYEFINGYRVKAAMRLLSGATEARVSLLDAAMEAGFNSQSTFYSHFRKHTGMTPRQYRSQQAG